MSETTDLVENGARDAAGPTEAPAASGTTGSTRRRGNGLSGMLLPELQRLAAELGISGTGRMRKGDLVAAISARQVGGSAPADAPSSTNGAPAAAPAAPSADAAAPVEAPVSGGANGGPLNGSSDSTTAAPEGARPVRTRRGASRPAGSPSADALAAEVATVAGGDAGTAGASTEGAAPRVTAPRATVRSATASAAAAAPTATAVNDRERQPRGWQRPRRQPGGGQRPRAPTGRVATTANANRDGWQRPRAPTATVATTGTPTARAATGAPAATTATRGGRPDNRNDGRNTNDRNASNDEDDDDFEGGRGRRGRRYRDRNRRGGNAQGGGRDRFDQGEPTVSEDDVLLPVAGILDVLDNYAFVRTSGYLTGPNDVYVSLSQVRRHGLRRGDAITGAVRQPREGERKDKYNALVRLDTVNGLDPEQARNRPEFTKLTPLYPQERLRLETEPQMLTTRVIDLVMPIGKGQRALIVSPPKAGKTMVLQALANAITTNNPECHLMVVLVDERPEEVTDMQRSVKGEVIASTFDRPPADHTTVAELSIERAKRLVEMGHDVVVLLDSITRLGRAYNLAAPASGRILSGGVDSTALYPPKRFLGAARNIENGGSLTIIASALVETGSTMDTVIFEEFKGTGNAEIKLDRRLADKRVFPAVDVNASGTRKEEILMNPEELAIVIKLRRVLAALEPQQALELLLDKLKKTRNNVEFLMQIQKTTLGPGSE